MDAIVAMSSSGATDKIDLIGTFFDFCTPQFKPAERTQQDIVDELARSFQSQKSFMQSATRIPQN